MREIDNNVSQKWIQSIILIALQSQDADSNVDELKLQ